ncbi:HlyD family efflux transporter periplasmic adaptor subunit [Bradyrhizobium sp. ERR14]|uniref:HlyD family efflux transporter periplasmic adaptor subunit n=1 Tax=Bradyrhizobium sp. ERR14 TaxID=2663837 RepID=UPI0017E8AFF9|nr:HlyD family efflux transporter periplasmic adaptor subunit [Bradyrhizobium sp. ERR14]MBB4391264.1 RND family efflux transporter MFP subunit [Bradyrhizobium sp. ERR14]
MFMNQRCPKGRPTTLWLAGLGWLASLFFGLSGAFAHEGHDHGDADKPAAVSSAYPRVVARSELYEIVGIVKDGKLSVFIDDAVTNEPVSDAGLQVTIGDSAPIEAPSNGEGIYTATIPNGTPPGSVDVIFSVSARKGNDLLVDSFIRTRAGDARLPQQKHERGWLFSSRTAIAASALAALGLGLLFAYWRRRGRSMAASISAAMAGAFVVLAAIMFGEGRTNPTPPNPPDAPALSDAPRRLQDGTVFAAKPTQRLLDVRTAAAEPQTIHPAVTLIGRVMADPNRSSIVQSVYGGRVVPSNGGIPRIGQTVRKGDLLIQIEPHLPVADRTTILEKVGEIEQLMAVTENKLRRLRPLAERGAVPQGQVNDLESELEGLRARRETVRNSRTGFEELRASTDGIITSAKVVPGQVIQPQDILFQIADPRSLWVEALAYDDIGLKQPEAATAMAPNGQQIALTFVGTSRALRQHASVVQFAMPEPPTGLNIGQPLNVMVQTGAPVTGLLFPRNAVVRSGNGENIVWQHSGPERFEPKPVRVLPVDAAHVIVAVGLNEGERIVVRGTDLINQIR